MKLDGELLVINRIQAQLETLDPQAQARVMTYLVSKVYFTHAEQQRDRAEQQQDRWSYTAAPDASLRRSHDQMLVKQGVADDVPHLDDLRLSMDTD